MKIKLERKQKIKKVKKNPTLKIGPNPKLTKTLWIVLLTSIAFGVYKNFTAIDQHTTHEKEIIKTKIVDTNIISSFVSNFAEEYFSWEPKQDLLDKRTNNLQNYLTEELLSLNLTAFRSDIPTKATVDKVQIWTIDTINKQNYQVLFSVTQTIDESTNGKNSIKRIDSAFKVIVHLDSKSNLIITQNPTMSSLPEKSTYEPKLLETDGTVNATETEEIQHFLATFFKIYPTANTNELVYYVKNASSKSIEKEYVFSELVNPIIKRKNNALTVYLSIKYLDTETKAVQIPQFNLIVEKIDGNWMIIDGL